MPDDKKLIIDEDWKSQVEAEKRQAQQVDAAPAGAAKTAAGRGGGVAFPPASFQMLLTTLATEALMALGEIPNPIDGQVSVHRDQARYLIDTIEILQQKTKGNLTPDEEQAIDSVLHQLRMVFISTGHGTPERAS